MEVKSLKLDTMKMVIKEVDKDSKVFLLDAKLVSYELLFRLRQICRQ